MKVNEALMTTKSKNEEASLNLLRTTRIHHFFSIDLVYIWMVVNKDLFSNHEHDGDSTTNTFVARQIWTNRDYSSSSWWKMVVTSSFKLWEKTRVDERLVEKHRQRRK